MNLKKKKIISFQIPMKFSPFGPTDNKLSLSQLRVWCGTYKKPLFKPVMTQSTDSRISQISNAVHWALGMLGDIL